MSESLPKLIPIFPLFGCILLPKTILPLQIFEPRYRQMVEHSLENHALIGMIQPQNSEDEILHNVGCLGRIEHSQKQPNGNYLIQLHGEIRFEIKREIEVETLYRQVEVDYNRFKGDTEEFLENQDFSELADAFKFFSVRKNLQVEWEKLESIPIHYLVNILCMKLEFSPLEKQALLEAPCLNKRWDYLITLLQMAVVEEGTSSYNFIN